MNDWIFFIGILCIAIASYGIISKIRGRGKTVLIVLGDEDEDEGIQKGAKEAGADLNVNVVFSTSLDEDIAEYSPNSIVMFSDGENRPEQGRVFNGRGNRKQNRPADSFAAGYLAVVTAHVNFMSEEF